MNAFQLAWLMLKRDYRAGELRLLGLALVLAVASLTSVSFFVDRMGQALTREANQLLGGDLLLVADHPWREEFRSEAVRRGARAISSLSFTSMAMTGNASQLVGVKVVEPGHPLRGALRVAPGLNQPDGPAPGIPEPGTVWLDERATSALGVKPGDRVQLGDSSLRVAAVLTFESDRGASFFSFVPRLMLNASDLAATGLVQVGSRVVYRLHVAGTPRVIEQYRAWASARLERGEQLEDIGNARPEVQAALERAQRFLGLASLLAVVLAAVAIGLSAGRFLERHLDGCAVMRCLGAGQGQITRLYLGEFLIFGVLASGLGCAVGFAAQLGIERVLSGLLNGPLPAPGWMPVVRGFLVGMVLIAGFVLPQLLRLANVPTLRVIRREWAEVNAQSAAGYAAGIAALAFLVFWIAEDGTLGAVVFGGFAGAVLGYSILARVALALLARVRGAAGAGWRQGLAALGRRVGSSVVQIMALGIGLTALLLISVARQDLLEAWRGRVPPDAPNRFVINIQPDQRDAIRQSFRDEGLAAPDLLPMVRGRLVEVNDRAVSGKDYDGDRARRLVEREFNLSYAAELPEGNKVTAGRWFSRNDRGKGSFSVEKGLASTLGLALGDRLTFEVAGNRVSGTVDSLRSLDWDSMRVNFFVIAPPGVIDDFPTSYITSFHVPADRAEFANALVQQFPNLTVIDVDAVIRQIQAVVDQLATAVQFVLAFALAAGLAVILAAMESTHDQRAYEMAVMRTLGARARQLRLALTAEFATLGAVAGLLGGIGATAISYALATKVFKMPYTPTADAVVLGCVAGMVGVTLAGLIHARRGMNKPALQSLRALG